MLVHTQAAPSAMLANPAGRSSCHRGRHFPSARVLREEDGTRRSTCRFCGSDIAKTLSAKRWFFSGLLG